MNRLKEHLNEYKSYLLLEKRMSLNSIEAYMRDINQFVAFLLDRDNSVDLLLVKHSDVSQFAVKLYDAGTSKSSQARIISGVKSFYNYLYLYDKIESLPTELIQTPKSTRKLPQHLSVDELSAMVSAIDLSQPMGHRNRAIIELMYSCGLRVSELISLRMSDLFFEENYIRVIGKGDKQRLVPISDYAISKLKVYMDFRRGQYTRSRDEDHLFIGRTGTKLSRVMVFIIVKELALKAGITKTISPHTLRHTFATHLVVGGADIRLVQLMLGHESITTTDIYTHLDSSHLRESIERYHPIANMAATKGKND